MRTISRPATSSAAGAPGPRKAPPRHPYAGSPGQGAATRYHGRGLTITGITVGPSLDVGSGPEESRPARCQGHSKRAGTSSPFVFIVLLWAKLLTSETRGSRKLHTHDDILSKTRFARGGFFFLISIYNIANTGPVFAKRRMLALTFALLFRSFRQRHAQTSPRLVFTRSNGENAWPDAA